MDRMQFFNRLRKNAHTHTGFFGLTPGLFFLTILIAALNVVLIFQFLDVWSASNGVLSILIFPSQYLFEQVLHMDNTSLYSIAVWIVELLYDYIIACILRFIFVRPKKWEGLIK